MGYYARPEKQAQRVISWGLALGSGRRNNKSPALIHSISTANSYRSASHHILQMDSKKSTWESHTGQCQDLLHFP